MLKVREKKTRMYIQTCYIRTQIFSEKGNFYGMYKKDEKMPRE